MRRGLENFHQLRGDLKPVIADSRLFRVPCIWSVAGLRSGTIRNRPGVLGRERARGRVGYPDRSHLLEADKQHEQGNDAVERGKIKGATASVKGRQTRGVDKKCRQRSRGDRQETVPGANENTGDPGDDNESQKTEVQIGLADKAR